MLKVYTFAPAWGLPTPSSFGLKLETWLRMASIPYECEYVTRPMASPKRTVPWICDGETLLADSGFILEYLRDKYDDPLRRDLTAQQQATAHAVRRMLEEYLARIIGYTRWLTEENWAQTRDIAFGEMEEPWKSDISAKAREKMREDMELHGIGRHTPDEVQHLGTVDIQAIEELLGAKPYLFGDQPHDVDASIFGVLAQFIVPPLDCAISDYARSSQVLTAYIEHMLRDYFPDYAKAL
jgi:glutathione S-transferase